MFWNIFRQRKDSLDSKYKNILWSYIFVFSCPGPRGNK